MSLIRFWVRTLKWERKIVLIGYEVKGAKPKPGAKPDWI
jgi:hypothetical protein